MTSTTTDADTSDLDLQVLPLFRTIGLPKHHTDHHVVAKANGDESLRGPHRHPPAPWHSQLTSPHESDCSVRTKLYSRTQNAHPAITKTPRYVNDTFELSEQNLKSPPGN